MKALPLPFEEFQGKGVLDFISSSSFPSSASLLSDSIPFLNTHKEHQHCYVGSEPTSVLDITRNPSPPTSTLSSSHASSGGGPPERCGMGMEDWESVLSESPGQDHSILRFIMGDIEEDPSIGLSKLLQSGGGGGGGSASQDAEFNVGFGLIDQSSNFDPISAPNFGFIDQSSNLSHNVSKLVNPNPPADFPFSPLVFPPEQEEKPQILHNPNFILNQNHQPQFLPSNPGFVTPEYPLPLPPPPPAKRPNCGGGPKAGAAAGSEEQGIIDKLYKAAEMIESGSPELAHGILARLNHQLSPIGKPFQRAAFYMKEALLQLLTNPTSSFSPTSLLLKIGAYKSFSEISPLLQFANFTSNQALLEAVDGFTQIHIIDFDIGFGGQWASFMQELSLLRNGTTPPSLKITAFVPSPSNLDEIELSFTQDNLKQYASDINIPFQLEILTLDSLNLNFLNLTPFRDCEAKVVNFPISSFSSCPSFLPLVLRFLKQLMPKILVTVERTCDRTESPFPQLLVHTLQSYSTLLESLDAANVNLDVLQMIEKYYVQPAMEKVVSGRRERVAVAAAPWRTLFLSCGFSPAAFSGFTETQAECLVQRSHARGFHVEKRQSSSSIVLGFQRKDLISVSSWRCC